MAHPPLKMIKRSLKLCEFFKNIKVFLKEKNENLSRYEKLNFCQIVKTDTLDQQLFYSFD